MAPHEYQFQPQSADSMNLFGSYDMLQMQPLSPSALNLSNDPEPQPTNNFTRGVPQSAEGQVVAALEGMVALHKKTNSSQDERGQRLERKVDQQEQTLQNLGGQVSQVLARLNDVFQRLDDVAASNQQQSARSDEVSAQLGKIQLHFQLMMKALAKRSDENFRSLEKAIKAQFDELIKLEV